MDSETSPSLLEEHLSCKSCTASLRRKRFLAMAEGLVEVAKVLKSLKENESFHGALEHPSVSKAVRHWGGLERLKPEECEEWQSDPRIMFVLAEFRRLEHFCRAAGMKVPLHTVLAKKDDLTLSDGRRLSGGELLPPEKKEEEEEAEDLLELPDPPPMDARTWKKTFLWQVISIVFVLIVTQLGTWYHEEELRKILANSTAGRGNDSAEL
ncbi:unnamed protein product [Effrenium voratum]|nr:unnamed protein product [Effrenium voratum]